MATDPNTIRHYDQNAEDYHRHVTNPQDGTYHAFYEKPAIRRELPSLQNLDVISIGCGSGVDARWLADNGAKTVVGVDISTGLLEIARRENPDIEFIQMDMEELGFAAESFDLAYSSLAIHYVDDWTKSLKEARRILRPGGHYVFSCGHPLDSAMEYITEGDYKYARLGRQIDVHTKKRRIYGDYLAKEGGGIKRITGKVGDMEVTFYHRTFSRMLEHICDSGFTIVRMVEPQPIEGDPEHYEQLTKTPAFMIWVLKK